MPIFPSHRWNLKVRIRKYAVTFLMGMVSGTVLGMVCCLYQYVVQMCPMMFKI